MGILASKKNKTAMFPSLQLLQDLLQNVAVLHSKFVVSGILAFMDDILEDKSYGGGK